MLSRMIRGVLCLGAAASTACGGDASSTASTTTAPVVVSTNATCTSTLTLTAGQVVTGLSGTAVCVGASTSAAEYALIPFNGATAATTATFNVTATGTTAPSALPNEIATTGATFDVVAGSSLGLSASPAYQRSRTFEAGLRKMERASLPQLIPGARIWQRQAKSQASFDAIPSSVTVGQMLRLNANANVGCSAPNYRTARVVAVSNRAIVVADTGNPSGGYTDAEYASFATTFDTLIDPLDRQAFGDPTDIDGNGRILLFFTKTVNDLTPATSSSYVGGFFFGRDLFPATATVDFDACPTSNMGEMFYIMVPDPARGGPFTKTNVLSEVTGTLAHEYQHLINASRRMYVNTAATDFEETWLDEGLAHTAEELLFFRVSGLQPRQNLDATAIRRSTAIINAFNNYESDNFGRYNDYLLSPSAYSPYADNDSLPTRGAIRAFLRYAADLRGASDGDTWSKLVNSTTTGLANLQNVFGTGVINELRDWGVSVLADDITGVTSAYQQPSWNYRSMFAALSSSSVFPLANMSLTPGTQSVSLTRGANAYLRFTVAAGSTATVQWSAAPSTVQFSLVRTK
ncbi:MAG: Peptidase hyicolysin [Gemmatimonadetes bacterium]|nr:Peptidase hyicolysin [Gemmatimonadota bacterium]